MVCVRFTPAIRFWRYALHSVHARHTFLSICLAFGSRLLFAACAPNRTACEMFRSYSAVGRDRHSCVLACHTVIGRVRFFMAIPTENERTERRGERSRRRGVGTFLRERIGFVMLSAGSTLGQNAEAALRPRPKPAPKSRMWKPHCGLSGLSSCDSRRK